MAHREQDFDYEVIESGNQFGFMQTQIDQEEENSISVADHYKGTPPLKAKKGKKNRNSHEIPSDYQVIDTFCTAVFMHEQPLFETPKGHTTTTTTSSQRHQTS